MSDGFLGRWARRKQDAREGRLLAEPPASPPPQAEPPAVARARAEPAPETAAEAAPPPTLDDALQLTPQSDFTPFVARGVAPEVKNAAMKKLFADPHFNVMDGLDIYIDDYSIPDPLPASMLRKMASAQFLKLFDDEKKNTAAVDASASVAAASDAAESAAARPDPAAEAPPNPQDDHADPDLRLQQDHAAGAPGSGHGPQ